jgi:hypothetical protein
VVIGSVVIGSHSRFSDLEGLEWVPEFPFLTFSDEVITTGLRIIL